MIMSSLQSLIHHFTVDNQRNKIKNFFKDYDTHRAHSHNQEAQEDDEKICPFHLLSGSQKSPAYESREWTLGSYGRGYDGEFLIRLYTIAIIKKPNNKTYTLI